MTLWVCDLGRLDFLLVSFDDVGSGTSCEGSGSSFLGERDFAFGGDEACWPGAEDSGDELALLWAGAAVIAPSPFLSAIDAVEVQGSRLVERRFRRGGLIASHLILKLEVWVASFPMGLVRRAKLQRGSIM